MLQTPLLPPPSLWIWKGKGVPCGFCSASQCQLLISEALMNSLLEIFSTWWSARLSNPARRQFERSAGDTATWRQARSAPSACKMGDCHGRVGHWSSAGKLLPSLSSLLQATHSPSKERRPRQKCMAHPTQGPSRHCGMLVAYQLSGKSKEMENGFFFVAFADRLSGSAGQGEFPGRQAGWSVSTLKPSMDQEG